MATFTPLAGSATASSARSSLLAGGVRLRTLLIYWHLLSLDAPTVAMLWTWFIAGTCGIQLPKTSVLAMGVAVWILYAADRLLDANIACPPQTLAPYCGTNILGSKHGLEPRHLFHSRHRPAFLIAIALALLILAFLVPHLPEQSLRLYFVLGTLLVAYFALIHLQQNLAPRLPKEIAVGFFFSAATFIPTITRNPALRGPLLPAAILFGLTCTLNCLFIYVWEHPTPFPEAHPATRFALRVLPELACAAIVVSSVLALRPAHWRLPSAIAAAAALLLILHANRRHLDPTTLRAAADLCLLTPAVFALASR